MEGVKHVDAETGDMKDEPRGNAFFNLFRRLSNGARCKKALDEEVGGFEGVNRGRRYSETSVSKPTEDRKLSLGYFAAIDKAPKNSARRSSDVGVSAVNRHAGRRQSDSGLLLAQPKPRVYVSHNQNVLDKPPSRRRPMFVRQHSADDKHGPSSERLFPGPGYGRRQSADHTDPRYRYHRSSGGGHSVQEEEPTDCEFYVPGRKLTDVPPRYHHSSSGHSVCEEEEEELPPTLFHRQRSDDDMDGGKEAVRAIGGFWRQMSDGGDSVFSNSSSGDRVFAIDMEHLEDNEFSTVRTSATGLVVDLV